MKDKSYEYLRRRYKIHPLADDDKDKVRNYMDCRPWDKKKHGIFFGDEEPEDFEKELEEYKRKKDIERQSALFEDPEFIEELAFETAKGEHKSKYYD